MSTRSKHAHHWYRQTTYWIGWIAGGMTSVLAFALTSTFVDHAPYLWSVNVGYAAALLPAIGFLIWSSRDMKRRMREIEADYSRRLAEEDKHEQ